MKCTEIQFTKRPVFLCMLFKYKNIHKIYSGHLPLIVRSNFFSFLVLFFQFGVLYRLHTLMEIQLAQEFPFTFFTLSPSSLPEKSLPKESNPFLVLPLALPTSVFISLSSFSFLTFFSLNLSLPFLNGLHFHPPPYLPPPCVRR